MVKHTQTIRQQIADESFECVWPFCEIGAKRVKTTLNAALLNIYDEVENEIGSTHILTA